MKHMIRLIRDREGATAVEFAFIVPVVILLICGSIELGRTVMVQHILEEAARAGCRVATLESGTKQDVRDVVDEVMSGSSVSTYTVSMNPDPPLNMSRFDPVTVWVSTNYSDVSWISFRFMTGKSMTGTCVMAAEEEINTKSRKMKTKKTKTRTKTKTKVK